MSNINVLEDIIFKLETIATEATDKLIISAARANEIKYRKMLSEELNKNALAVVEYKIAHLVKRLK